MYPEFTAPISGSDLYKLLQAAGVDAAFGRLYSDYYQWMLDNVLSRLHREQKCPNPDAHALRLVNRSFAKMYEQLEKMDRGEVEAFGNLKGYLYKVYKNFITKHLQRHAKQLEREISIDSDPGLVERIARDRLNPEVVLSANLNLGLVADLMLQESTKRRLALEMLAAEKNATEIAFALNEAPATVRQWICRFRRRLEKNGLKPKSVNKKKRGET